jgi:hypothetical protein
MSSVALTADKILFAKEGDMGIRSGIMFLAVALAAMLLGGCGDNAFEGLADDGSRDACLYQTSLDLDNGNYAGVLDSSCAGPMQRGAACVGLAGFDITTVIDRVIEANSASSDTVQIEVYMKSLVGEVQSSMLAGLYEAGAEYAKALPDPDARFYLDVIIRPLISLATLKGIIDPDGDGALSDCDINGNSTPDEVDAASCALLVAAGQDCSTVNASYSSVSPLTFPNESSITATYTGLNITVAGTSVGTCDGAYKQLLDSASSFVVAVGSETCLGSDNSWWNCPIEIDGQPLDLVGVFEENLNAAVDTAAALTGAQGSEISTAMDELIADACGVGNVCTPDEISGYLQNL